MKSGIAVAEPVTTPNDENGLSRWQVKRNCGRIFPFGSRTGVLPGAVISVAAEGDSPRKFGDFEFVVPAGWTIVTPDRDKTKAMLLLDGTSWQDCRAMIKVDVLASADATNQILATVGAAGESARPVSMDFDGVSGVMNSKTSNSMTEPRQTIALIRNQQVHFVMVGAVEGVEVSDAIEAIRSSWKWIR